VKSQFGVVYPKIAEFAEPNLEVLFETLRFLCYLL
jgi:hypothetical protein